MILRRKTQATFFYLRLRSLDFGEFNIFEKKNFKIFLFFFRQNKCKKPFPGEKPKQQFLI